MCLSAEGQDGTTTGETRGKIKQVTGVTEAWHVGKSNGYCQARFARDQAAVLKS